MTEMVGSALVQEAVSGAISFLFRREEKASQGQLMDRLEMAHCELECALERSKNMPITEVSLLRREKILKRAFDECNGVLHTHKSKKLRVTEDQDAEQVVPLSSSFPKKFILAVKPSILSYLSKKKDFLDRSDVERFEWLADKAGKFIRDVESGGLLAHYGFFSPLITQLLDGENSSREMLQGSQGRTPFLETSQLEEHGSVASSWSECKDREMPVKKLQLMLMEESEAHT